MIDAIRFWIATPFYFAAGALQLIGDFISEGPRWTLKRWREGF